MQNPLVSVIIPTVNGRECLLQRAVGSVMLQTYDNIEIIIVDEGLPATTQRNIGIGRAKGEFIAFLDDDDEWKKDKTTDQVFYLTSNSMIAGCVTYMEDRRIGSGRISKPKLVVTHKDLVKGFNISSTSSHMYRRTVLDYLKTQDGYWFDESLPSGHEYDLALRVTRLHDMGTVPVVHVIQHKSPGQISTNWNKKVRGQFAFMDKHGHEYSFVGWMKRIGLVFIFFLGNIFNDKIMYPINFMKNIHEEQEKKKMLNPDFIICGTQKGGTRALLDFLDQHPDVAVCQKEINFFSWHYDKGYDWYIKHFKSGEYIGEKSPSYMFTPEVAERIFKHLSDVKLIFLLRDPIKRAYSHYWMNVRRGKEKRSFSQAIREPEKMDKYGTWCYLSRGLYKEKLDRFRKYFPDSQIYITQSELLRDATGTVLQEVSDFLGLSQFMFNTEVDTKIGVKPRSEFVTKTLQTRFCKAIPPLYKYLALYNNISTPYLPMKEKDKKFLEAYYGTKGKMYMASEQRM